VQKVVNRHGLLYIGDCKMAALSTRAYLVQSGDFYCMPLSAVQLNAESRAELLKPVWEGKQELSSIERTNEKGERQVIAQGFSLQRTQQISGEEQAFGWQERLQVVRSLKFAAAEERGLRECVAKAVGEVEGL
jgi:hypothetical protein